jgi:hypothetical protein
MGARPTEFTNYIPGSIQDKRTNAIESMIGVIHDLITKYSGPNIVCKNGSGFSCDARILGSLSKASAIIGILPRPEGPYPGMKSKTLAEQIRGMQVLEDCQGMARGYYGYGHGIKDSIKASMGSLEDCILGLHLMTFLPKTGKWSEKGKKKAKVDKKVEKQQDEF